MAFTWSPDTVWLLLQKAWWFLVVLGVLVAFHELGHFLAARWVGVKVLKFSLGFGPKLFGRKMGETEYLLSAIPLGGYVKLFGEDETEATTQEDRTRSFAHQRLWGKVLIVAAGPGFNFILAYFIFAGWLATGTPLFVPTFQDLTPDIEAMVPGSPADTAGIQIGDRVSRVNGRDISTRTELFDAVAKSNGQALTIEIKRGEQVKTLTVTPTTAPGPHASAQEPGYYLGVEETPPLVTSVMQSSPAAKAGLQAGDHVVDIEGQTIHTWSQMTGIVKESPNLPLKVEVLREGHRVSLTVTPSAEKAMVNGQSVEVVKIVVGVALGLPIFMWLFQERMLFFPRSLESRPALRPNVEEVTLVAADGVKLRGWIVKSAGMPAPLVIYFGGNAEEVSWLAGVADQFAGWSLLLVNFRGYGESEGKPGEKELFEDALLIYDYAKRRPEVSPERIVAMGRSLGSGVAVHLAAHRPLRGVILVSPYDSIAEVAKRHYPFLPVSLMLRHRFDSLVHASQIEAPLLCLVATEDRIIPSAHSRVLFEAWRGSKTWREVPRSDHDSISGEPEYWRSIAEFLKALR